MTGTDLHQTPDYPPSLSRPLQQHPVQIPPLQDNTPCPSSIFHPSHWCLRQLVRYSPRAAMHHQYSLHHHVSADKQTNSPHCQGRGEITARFHFPMRCPWTAMCHNTAYYSDEHWQNSCSSAQWNGLFTGSWLSASLSCLCLIHYYEALFHLPCLVHSPSTVLFNNQNYGLSCSNKIHKHFTVLTLISTVNVESPDYNNGCSQSF